MPVPLNLSPQASSPTSSRHNSQKNRFFDSRIIPGRKVKCSMRFTDLASSHCKADKTKITE